MNLILDFVVTSGMRFYYDQPRRYDAGILTTGAASTSSLIIPPKQEKWIIKGYCSKDCTNVSLFQRSLVCSYIYLVCKVKVQYEVTHWNSYVEEYPHVTAYRSLAFAQLCSAMQNSLRHTTAMERCSK